MPFVPVTSGYQVRLRYTLFDQEIENTLWFGSSGVPGTITPALAASALTNWTNFVMPELSADITLREAYATDESSASGPSATATPGSGPVPGGQTGVGLPGSVAFCISFRTLARGRSFRGRIYLPGLREADVVGNEVDSGRATAFVNAVETACLEIAEDIGGDHMVCSRFTNGAPRTAGILTAVVNYGYADLSVDSQRRRLPGRGN